MKTSRLALATEIDGDSDDERVERAAIQRVTVPSHAVTVAGGPAGSKPSFGETIENIDWASLTLSWTVRILSLAAGVAIWQWACDHKFHLFINFANVPSPRIVLSALIAHVHETRFYLHILASLERILIAFALASVFGILLGVVMGRSRIARDLVMPYIEIMRPIPAVAWIPLAILIWPTEESSIIYITFLGALFPIVLNTVHGVEQTPEVLVRAAQSLGAKPLHIFWHVVMPAALPSIATGLAIGMGVAWFSLLAGEIISGQYGIGYFTWSAYSLVNYPDIVVGMLAIGFLGTASTLAVRKMMQPLLSWQRKSR
jgi:NitT/TauT family transport system permease protein